MQRLDVGTTGEEGKQAAGRAGCDAEGLDEGLVVQPTQHAGGGGRTEDAYDPGGVEATLPQLRMRHGSDDADRLVAEDECPEEFGARGGRRVRSGQRRRNNAGTRVHRPLAVAVVGLEAVGRDATEPGGVALRRDRQHSRRTGPGGKGGARGRETRGDRSGDPAASAPATIAATVSMRWRVAARRTSGEKSAHLVASKSWTNPDVRVGSAPTDARRATGLSSIEGQAGHLGDWPRSSVYRSMQLCARADT